jgi:hypothetical protein
MKKWLWVPILVILFFLFCCQKKEKTEQMEIALEGEGEHISAIAETVGNNLDLAIEDLEKGQFGAGTGKLLDSVLLVKPQSQWPEGFVSNISTAKEFFETGNFSDAVEYVSKALNLVKLPDETKQSTESEKIAPVAAIIKGKIAEAKEEFKKDNADSGVIAILEALQLLAPRVDKSK